MSLYDIKVEYGWGEDDAAEEPAPDWLRVPPGEFVRVTVLSPEPIQYWGHWDQSARRFRRCGLADNGQCRWCISASGHSKGRQLRYIVALLEHPSSQDPSSQDPPGRNDPPGREDTPDPADPALGAPAGALRLFEFGTALRDQIKPLLAAGWPLRGLPLVLVRPPARNQGPMPILCHLARREDGKPEPLDVDALPPAPDVAVHLWRLWVRQALHEGKGGAGGDPLPSSSPSLPGTNPQAAPPRPPMPSGFAEDFEARTGRPPRGLGK